MFCLFNVDVNVVIVSQHPPPIIPFLLGCLSTCSYIFNGANQIHMQTHTIKIWRLLQMAADVLVCLHTHTLTHACVHTWILKGQMVRWRMTWNEEWMGLPTQAWTPNILDFWALGFLLYMRIYYMHSVIYRSNTTYGKEYEFIQG